MSRKIIRIEERWWSDARRSALIRILGDQERADGVVIRLWASAFDFWKDGRKAIPVKHFELIPDAKALVEASLVDLHGDGNVYAKGSRECFEWIFKKREAGRLGGKQSAKGRAESKIESKKKAVKKQRSSKTKAVLESDQTIEITKNIDSLSLSNQAQSSSASNGKLSTSNSELSTHNPKLSTPPMTHQDLNRVVWEKYQQLMRQKFNAAPERNAKLNAQIAQFTKRIPGAEVLALVDFYFKSDNQQYIRNYFDLGLLLQDCEKLLVQMRGGVKMHDTRPPGGRLQGQALHDRNIAVAKEYMEDKQRGGTF